MRRRDLVRALELGERLGELLVGEKRDTALEVAVGLLLLRRLLGLSPAGGFFLALGAA